MEKRNIEISEETLARLVNPDYFKYSNYQQWLEDRRSERWHRFYALSAIIFLILVAIIIVFFAGKYNLINKDLQNGLFGGVIGSLISVITVISQSYFTKSS